jgi:putative ABC transport system ATP-binding protein
LGKGDGNIIKNSLPDDGFPIVESSNVRKDYLFGSLKIPILSNVNLKNEREDCRSIENPSCSGKNTPVNHIGCFGFTKGYVVRGNDLNRVPYQEFVNHWNMKKWFFQFFNHTPYLTALENTLCSTVEDSRTGIDPNRLLEEIFEVVELPDCMHYRSRNPSRNKFQEISIARALS